jgi:hypothetical protein
MTVMTAASVAGSRNPSWRPGKLSSHPDRDWFEESKWVVMS